MDPPAEGKTMTIAAVLRSVGKGLPGTEEGTMNTGVTLYVTPPAAVKINGLSAMTMSPEPSLGETTQVEKTNPVSGIAFIVTDAPSA